MATRIMYDSTTTTDIPDDAELVAYYPYTYPGPVNQFKTAQIVRIDNQGDHHDLPVLDVESGAASVADAPVYLDAHEKDKGWSGTIYCNKSTLPQVLKAIGSRKMNLWIADPTGIEHVWAPDPKLPPNVTLVATQFAWPGRGSAGHYDISAVSNDDWFKEPVKPELVTPPDVTQKAFTRGIVITDELKTYSVSSLDEKTWIVS